MPLLRLAACGLTGVLLLTIPSPAGTAVIAGSESPTDAVVAAASRGQVASVGRDGGPATDGQRRGEPLQVVDLPQTSLSEPTRGRTAIRELGDDLPAIAREHDLRPAELRQTLRTDSTIWVAPTGHLVVKEQRHPGMALARADVAPAAAPLDQTFELHSLAGSAHVIYLDFDGVSVTEASNWVSGMGLSTGQYEGWDPMNDGPAFSAAERAAVQEIWARVAEDFAPFDVDVTTADPGEEALRPHDGGDSRLGTRLVVTDSVQAPAALCPDGCGGVAFVGQIDRPSAVAEPAWVFAELNSQSPKAIAEAASHEVGHTFGLWHDGYQDGNGDTQEYYAGHGVWAPIMGAAYEAPVSQWSNGFYQGATNPSQDDLAVIASITGYRTDEGGDGWDAPLRRTDQTAYITRSSDADVYLVDECVAGARAAAVTSGDGANLDLALTLARPSSLGGSPMTSVNPLVAKVATTDTRPWYGGSYLASAATGLDASVDLPTGGPWLVEVRSGDGRTSEEGDIDYSSYGSLGAYQLQVEGCSSPPAPPARPTGLTVTPSGADLVVAWTAPVDDGGFAITGYRLTLNGEDPVDVGSDVTSYTFLGAASRNVAVGVRALSQSGAGAAATQIWNPTTTPSQVTQVTVQTEGIRCSFGPRGITVAWSPPAQDGGSPVLRYEFWQGDGESWWELFPGQFTGPGGAAFCFNPVSGTPYRYRIVPVNANGPGAPVTFDALLAGPPARTAPTLVSDRDARTVTVRWNTPFDGGAPIQKYELALTDGRIENAREVVLAPGATSYTFTGVRTGPRHVLLEAINEWSASSVFATPDDVPFDMPPISPDPGPIASSSLTWTVLDKAAGSVRVSWDAVVPADPDHDPILWYDVCVNLDGSSVSHSVQLPGNVNFGDGTVRGTDLCGGGTYLALTADATESPSIVLTGLPVEPQWVAITPVNPGGPAYMPSIKRIDFTSRAITCGPPDPQAGQLNLTWSPPEAQVISYTVRTRHRVEGVWTDWSTELFPSGLPAYSQGIYQLPVAVGEWQVEVRATLNLGGLAEGPATVCEVTVPSHTVDPTPHPTDGSSPTDPSETASPTDPSSSASPSDPTPSSPVTSASASASASATATPTRKPSVQPVRRAPSAPKVTAVKPGAKGGAKTLTVTWGRPVSSGSAALTTYEVIVYRVQGRKLVVAARKGVPSTKRTLSIALKAGSYKVAVRARNGVGWSPASATSKAVKPR